jgi:hypothetical protein
MVKVLHNNIFLILLACVVGMASLVEAWTTTSLVVSGCALTINPRLASLAIHYRNESVDDQQFEFQATTATSTTTITSFTTTTEEHDTNISLQIALQAAQDADRLHGLCSPASIRAWAVVDGIYLSSSASREVDSHVKRILGTEKSIWDLYSVV